MLKGNKDLIVVTSYMLLVLHNLKSFISNCYIMIDIFWLQYRDVYTYLFSCLWIFMLMHPLKFKVPSMHVLPTDYFSNERFSISPYWKHVIKICKCVLVYNAVFTSTDKKNHVYMWTHFVLYIYLLNYH
jgi:hypothetical protein